MKTIEERFWEKVKKTKTCWLWKGSIVLDRYGQIFIGKRKIRAHRLSWTIHFGEIPKGLLVCHHCDNPSCVNPKHLFLGTNKDNLLDAGKKGRLSYPYPGVGGGNSKLTKEQVLEIRKLYKKGSMDHRELAELFNVTERTIAYIISRGRWRNI